MADHTSGPSTSGGADARMTADTVRCIVQSASRPDALSQGAAALLASDAEYRLREIIQDSVKFMKHSKRARLVPDDVNAALRLRNVAPTYGFGRAAPTPTSIVRADAAAQDGKLEWRAADGVDNLFFTADRALPLRTLLERPLPPRPREVTVASHWLAVNGVQPAVPENPAPEGDGELDGEPTNGEANGVAGASGGARTNGDAVRHVLSKELQLYFDHMVETLAGDDTARVDAILTSVAEEPGLLQLLPYFVRHVTTSVRAAVDRSGQTATAGEMSSPFQPLRTLMSSMRLVRAMLMNEHFRLETYLHGLLPVVATCVVGKRLVAKPRDDHWQLRDYSARLLRNICSSYRDKYENLQTRLSKTLLSAFTDPRKSLTTHYGAIVGLSTLGKHVVDATILTRLGSYTARIQTSFSDSKLKKSGVRRYELAKVFGAIAFALYSTLNPPSKLVPFEPDMTKITVDVVPGMPKNFRETLAAVEREYGKDIYPHRKDDDSLRSTTTGSIKSVAMPI